MSPRLRPRKIPELSPPVGYTIFRFDVEDAGPALIGPERVDGYSGRDWFGDAVTAYRKLGGGDLRQPAVADAMEPKTSDRALRAGLVRQGHTWPEVREAANRT